MQRGHVERLQSDANLEDTLTHERLAHISAFFFA
jgi:hypothetical protein